MIDVDIDVIAKGLATLLPTIDIKLIRPMEQQARQLMSPMQIHAMLILNENDTFTMTELANEMKISKQQLTPIIDKLIESNFVCREYNADDRRIVKIRITPNGSNFLEDINKDVTRDIKARIACLNNEDLSTLQNALTDFYKVINKIL